MMKGIFKNKNLKYMYLYINHLPPPKKYKKYFFYKKITPIFAGIIHQKLT